MRQKPDRVEDWVYSVIRKGVEALRLVHTSWANFAPFHFYVSNKTTPAWLPDRRWPLREFH
jgi:hypothetical protein